MASTLRFDNWEDSNGNPIASKNSSFGGFNASVTITATDAAWAVPTLASPIVKITAVGGGGGGAAGAQYTPFGNQSGSNGGSTTVDASTAGTVVAPGGLGGAGDRVAGKNGTSGLSAGNGGGSSAWNDGGNINNSSSGNGGSVVVQYLDLTDIASLNVIIGAGGSGGTGSGNPGGDGGRGEVIIEYVAG